MTDDRPELDEADRRLMERLDAEDRPRPSGALRRRVRHRVGVALYRAAVRRRSAALVLVGGACLVVAAILALNVPR